MLARISLAPFVLASVVHPLAPDEQSGPVLPTQLYPAGSVPMSVLAADLDGDGAPDVVAANSGSNDVSVLRGLGNGGLTPLGTFAVGLEPQQVQAADLDGDGALDLATANAGSDDVTVLLGGGDGMFAPTLPVPVGVQPWSLVLEDFDADGTLDLATANRGGGDVTVRLGLGGGLFGAATTHAVGAGPTSIAAADFDGDGDVDLVTCNNVEETFSLLFAAPGGFAPAVTAPIDTHPAVVGEFWVVAGDVDLDGDADLAFANTGGLWIYWSRTVRLGEGDGTFGPPLSVSTTGAPRYMTLTSFDGDGLPDLVTGNIGYPPGVAIFRGNGDGTFDDGAISSGSYYPGFHAVEQVAVADFDGDGHGDVVGANPWADGVTVFLGRESGELGPRFVSDADFPEDIAALDLDGDGRVDLATGDWYAVRTWLGAGDGTFTAADSDLVSDDHIRIEAADFDADGRMDVACAHYGNSTADDGVRVFAGQGDGTLVEVAAYDPAAQPWSLASGDLNGDGALDLVVPGTADGAVSVQLGVGDGTFGAAQSFAAGAPSAKGVALADFDRDGRLDVVTANDQSDDATLLLGNGDGTVQAPTLLAAGSRPTWVEAADLDRDGLPDFVVVNQLPGGLSVFRGLGGASFAPAVPYAAEGGTPQQVAIGDLNDDGAPDLAVAVEPLLLFAGVGDGSFAEPIQATSGGSPWSVAIADVDADGRADVLSGNVSTGDVGVLLNRALPGLPFCGVPAEVSLSAGGQQAFQLDAGPGQAGTTYWIAGSFTGTSPGFSLFGVDVPLNPDGYFLATVNQPGAQTLVEPIGTLDADGASGAPRLVVVPGSPPSLTGVTLHHAFLALDPATFSVGFASNAVALALNP
ncbi:MAG: VCBS repeat-containing protein [Planctomycetota bacterium]